MFQKEIGCHIGDLLQNLGIEPKSGSLALISPNILSEVKAELELRGYHVNMLHGVKDIGNEYSAYILFSLAQRENEPRLLNSLAALCESGKAQLIVCEPNFSASGNVIRLLWGDVSPEFKANQGPVMGFTEKQLEGTLSAAGFKRLKSNDLSLENGAMPPADGEKGYLEEGTLAGDYLRSLKKCFDSNWSTHSFIRAYAATGNEAEKTEAPAEGSGEKRPFLTIITRTQGRRINELNDVFSCLEKQSCNDYELLLIGHKVEENTAALNACIANAPGNVKERICFHELNSGGPSAPLNLGLRLARGEYVIVLDDDDLVSESWVEVFYRLAQNNPGTILHAYCETQRWERNLKTGELRPLEEPQPTYCVPYDYIIQMINNRCPVMSVAFPTDFVRRCGRDFDEEMGTTNDWDLLMYLVFFLGVSEEARVTSTYRLWENAESSATMFNKDVWDENYHIVRDKMDKLPILLPMGSTRQLADFYVECQKMYDRAKAAIDALQLDRHRAVLYYSQNKRFSDESILTTENAGLMPEFSYKYKLSDEGARHFRFDPAENGGVFISGLDISFIDENGAGYKLQSSKIRSNGRKIDDFYVFMKDDPQIHFSCPGTVNARWVSISGRYWDSVSADLQSKIYKSRGNILGDGLSSLIDLAKRAAGKLT